MWSATTAASAAEAPSSVRERLGGMPRCPWKSSLALLPRAPIDGTHRLSLVNTTIDGWHAQIAISLGALTLRA